VAERLVFGVLEGLVQGRLQRAGFTLGHNGVQPGLNGHLDNL
jgi:hypothetical protein